MVFVTAGEGGGTGTGGAPGRGPDRPLAGRADHRRRDPAVRLRGPPPGQLGRDRHRRAARRGRHPHRHPQRPAAVDLRPRHLDAGRVQVRRPGAAAGRLRHHRPDHHAGPDQPRLRRREVGHVRRRLGADGHRLVARRQPRGRGRRDGDLVARCSRPASTAPTACCCRSPAAPTSGCSRSTRRPSWSPRPRTPRPTSSSVRSSTTPSATRSGSPSSRPASTAARRGRAVPTPARAGRAPARRRPAPTPPAPRSSGRTRPAGRAAGPRARARDGRQPQPGDRSIDLPREPAHAARPTRTIVFDDEGDDLDIPDFLK